MDERRNIHVFLGAPPSSDPGFMIDAGEEGQQSPPVQWSCLQLSWKDRQLWPKAEERGDEENVQTDKARLQGRDEERNDWIKEPSGGERTMRSVRSPDGEFNSEKEAQCLSSVHEYLDSCFPTARPPQTDPPQSLKHPSSPAAPRLSVQTQYLTTWTLSQMLMLRSSHGVPRSPDPHKTSTQIVQKTPSVSSSTPDLFSPATPSPSASAELFSPPQLTQQRAGEGGVVLEATADGVLCSQESTPTRDPSPTSPELKKTRLFNDSPTSQGPTTLLAQCNKPGVRYQVLVAVVHPCHLKEIKVKSGPSAGDVVPVASILVTDQSGTEMKVVLWRQAGFWVLTVHPGDVLLIRDVQVYADRWRGETVLQSTFSSKLLNLGPITKTSSPPAPRHVPARALARLCGYLQEWRPLLVSPSLHPPQDLKCLPYATLRSLRVNMLVHALLRVKHIQICTEWRSEAESRSRSALQQQAILTVEQPNGQQGVLLLWGKALEWLPRFKRDKAAIWDVRVLLVREGSTSDLPELHSTPWSSLQLLDTTDRRAQAFLVPQHLQTDNSSSVELDLDTLLSQKYSGHVDLTVQIIAFHFQAPLPSQSSPQLILDGTSSLEDILVVLNSDITYTGCGRCAAELDTDANGIYRPCYVCLPHTTVRRYYRPSVLTVGGQGTRQACVQVPPVLLQKIVDAPPDHLHRSSAPGSCVKHIQVAAERIYRLLSRPRASVLVTVQSVFLCDENNVTVTQDLTLWDLKFPM